MIEKTNRFLLEVEEMNCKHCQADTGHVLTGKFWTCCACGNQLGKKKESNFKKMWNNIFNWKL